MAPSSLPLQGQGSEAGVKGALSTLLSTGLYDSQDSLIQEMKGQLQE